MPKGKPPKVKHLEKCPSWCVEKHGSEVLALDVRHQSETALVAAIVRRVSRHPAGGTFPISAEPEELGVMLHRDFGSPDTWAAISDERQCLEVSLETAYRLMTALRKALPAVGD